MQLNRKQKNYNFLLTIIQYSTLVAFLYLSSLIAEGIVWQIIELSGVILGLWAIGVMRLSRINIAPAPLSNAQLIKTGPYKLIRHPMYLAIILTFTPLIITHFDLLRFLILMVLYINLIIKLLFEESLLKTYFDDYINYMNNTWRLIPWVF